MPRLYTINSTPSAETAALDFLELQPGDDLPNKLLGCELAQSTEEGDAQSEMLAIAIRRGNTTSGSGGVTTAANPVDANDAAYGGTTPETLNDTKATTAGGTIYTSAMNVQSGYFKMYPELTAPKVDQGDSRMCVELVDTPADSTTWSCGFDIMEQ
jgi:hypothetical protein